VYITEEYRASVKGVLDNALQGSEAANFEFPLFTKDQKRVEVLLNATTRRDVNGNVVGVIGVGQDVTERKQAELEMTRVAKELQTFIDTANAPIFGIDSSGLVNEWNNMAAKITGFPRDEVMGRNLVEVYITEEFRASVKEVFDNALQGSEAANFEFPLFTKDQKRREVLLNATTRRDVSGNVVGVIGVGQDVTKRKQAELEMTRVATELQTFIDTANAPIFGIDSNGNVNEWNNMAAKITGFTRDEVMGKNLVEVYITQEFRASVKDVLDNALQGSEAANFEFPLFTKDQKRVEVLLNATTRRDVSGNVVGVIGVGQDITERKQAEQEKSRVAKELQTFIDTANAPIFGIDAQGLVNEWNNKAVEITGFSRDEVMGQNLVEVYITEEFRASVKEVFDNALAGQEAANFEFPLFTKDQRRLEVLLNATSRRDVTGKIVGVIGVGQDITEMRRLMNQEAIFNQAQAANAAKSQFLANMSHEMRTPLNVIMGMSQLILDTSLSAEARKFTEQIMTSSESLLFLINEILDLTKIEAGQLELFNTNFDLRQVIEEAVDSVASRALRKGLEICSYLDLHTVSYMIGDPDRLRQILLNLLSNAIKFTKAGQVYVLVEQEESSQTHNVFRFKVYDSGIGIPEKGLKKLFARFSQVDSSTTREFGGTGLGLAISKEFAELMNGSMGVNSTPGVGSCFWFTATLQKAESDQLPMCISMTPKSSAMLVAHNETLRNTLMRVLDALGMVVNAVSHTSHLDVNTLQEDVVILCPAAQYEEGRSVEMADVPIDGDDLQTVWKFVHSGSHARRELKSIVLCPLTQLAQAAEFRRLPGCDVISRPVRVAVLRDALAQALNLDVSNWAESIANFHQSEAAKTSDAALFPYEITGTRILVAMVDAGQRMVLKAMLTRETHQCALCQNMSELAGMLKQRQVKAQGWNYDVVFIEYSSEDDGNHYAELSMVESIRRLESIEDLGRMANQSLTRLIVIGVVREGAEADRKVCLEAGMNFCIGKPIVRQAVTDAMGFLTAAREGSPDSMNIQGGETSSDSAQVPGGRRSTAIEVNPGRSGSAVAAGADGSDAVAKNIRVLVVDDDHGQRIVLKSMLQKSGYDVDTAEDGADAIKAVQRVAYDVVLMDGFMPNKTGWEATAQIRADEEANDDKKRLVIIGVTGATSREDEEKCFNSGMTDIISKPVKREALCAKINTHTAQLQTSEGAASTPPHPSTPQARVSDGGRVGGQKYAVVITSDKTQQVVIKRIMSTLSLAAIFCATEEACMKQIQEIGVLNVTVIIIDTGAAGLRVVGAINQLRKMIDGDKPDLFPIFAIAGQEQLTELKLMGFSGVLSKPLNPEAVKEAVLSHIASTTEGDGERCCCMMRDNIVRVHAVSNRINSLCNVKESGAVPCGDTVSMDAQYSTFLCVVLTAYVTVYVLVGISGSGGVSSPSKLQETKEVRVLIVEDHWANRRLLEAMLKKQVMRVEMIATQRGGETERGSNLLCLF
jgi:PAS domain S-box-containing protein